MHFTGCWFWMTCKGIVKIFWPNKMNWEKNFLWKAYNPTVLDNCIFAKYISWQYYSKYRTYYTIRELLAKTTREDLREIITYPMSLFMNLSLSAPSPSMIRPQMPAFRSMKAPRIVRMILQLDIFVTNRVKNNKKIRHQAIKYNCLFSKAERGKECLCVL